MNNTNWTTRDRDGKKGRFGREKKICSRSETEWEWDFLFVIRHKKEKKRRIFGSFLVCVYVCIKNIHQSHFLKS